MQDGLLRLFTRIVLPCAAFAALWIFLADRLLATGVGDATLLVEIQAYKGVAFILLISALMYGLLRREYGQRTRTKSEQQRLQARMLDILEGMTDGFVALDKNWCYLYVNRRAAEMLGRKPEDLIGRGIWTEFPEGTDQPFYQACHRAMAEQVPITTEDYYSPWDRRFESRVVPSADTLYVFFQDITERKRAENWRVGQQQVLVQIVAGKELSAVLNTLILAVEPLIEGALGSIMLLDVDGRHLRYAAGPNLPDALRRAIDGMETGPAAGACGTAVHDRQLVIVEDFQTDPRGVDFRELSARLKLRACWSQPVISATGQVLGTFAMYYREPCRPSPAEQRLIAETGNLVTVAIESARNRNTLVENEQRFRMTFEQAAVGIAHVAPDGRFLRVNQKFCDIVGYNRDEMLSGTFQTITHPDDLNADLGHVARLLAGEIPTYSMEKRYRRKDGSLVWVNLTVSLVHKDAGTADYFISVVEDITARRLVEQALQDSEALFAGAFHTSPAAITITRIADGKFIDVNQAFLDLFEFKRDEVIGRTSVELNMLSVEERGRLIRDQLKKGGLHDAELQTRSKSGRLVHLLFSSKPMQLAGELHHVTTLIDITARKQAEAALRESERTLTEAQRIAHIGSWRWNLTGPVQWTDELYRVYGVSPETFTPTIESFFDLVYPEDRPTMREWLHACSVGESPGDFEFRAVRPDGTVRFVRGSGDLVRDAAGRPIKMIGTAQDVTERKQTELRLSENTMRLEQLSRQLLSAQERERRQVARELHDEIGQLLTVVKLDLQTVLRQPGTAALASALKDGMSSIDRVVARVRDLSLDLRPSMLDDLGLVPTLRWYVQRHAKRLGAGVEITLTLPPALPRLRSEIETACFRVAQEALTNIARHAGAQRIEVTLKANEHDIELTVHDDGAGFDAAAARRLTLGGTGFGLLGMQERAELAGGELSLVSVPGRGTTVRARFPAAEAREATT